MKQNITLPELRKILAYNAAKGTFQWLERGKGRALGEFKGTVVLRHVKIWVESDELNERGIPLRVPKIVESRCDGYVVRIGNRSYPAHMLAYALHHGEWARISHLDGDKTNNCIYNLTTDRENSRKYAAQNAVNTARIVEELVKEKLAEKERYDDSISRRRHVIQEMLMAKYDYDPVIGRFKRKDDPYQTWTKGTPMKGNSSRTLFFTMPNDRSGKKWSIPCHQAAFVLTLGRYPKGLVKHLNGDKEDNRWTNLMEM